MCCRMFSSLRDRFLVLAPVSSCTNRECPQIQTYFPWETNCPQMRTTVHNGKTGERLQRRGLCANVLSTSGPVCGVREGLLTEVILQPRSINKGDLGESIQRSKTNGWSTADHLGSILRELAGQNLDLSPWFSSKEGSRVGTSSPRRELKIERFG